MPSLLQIRGFLKHDGKEFEPRTFQDNDDGMRQAVAFIRQQLDNCACCTYLDLYRLRPDVPDQHLFKSVQTCASDDDAEGDQTDDDEEDDEDDDGL